MESWQEEKIGVSRNCTSTEEEVRITLNTLISVAHTGNSRFLQGRMIQKHLFEDSAFTFWLYCLFFQHILTILRTSNLDRQNFSFWLQIHNERRQIFSLFSMAHALKVAHSDDSTYSVSYQHVVIHDSADPYCTRELKNKHITKHSQYQTNNWAA